MENNVFRKKQMLFKRMFREDKVEELRNFLQYSGATGTTVECNYDETVSSYPHYKELLGSEDELSEADSFIDIFEKNIGNILQGPFIIPYRKAITGPWNGMRKNQGFAACNIDRNFLEGKKVLDIGCNAGYDTFFLASLNPALVVGIDPSAFYYQALFLWTLYHAPHVQLYNCSWQSLQKEMTGTFDVINCQGIMYHEPSPVALLQKIFDLLEEGGTLILETHVTMRNEMRAKFVEGNFWGSPNWWWLTDTDTTLALLRSVGFVNAVVRLQTPVDSQNPNNPNFTVEGEPAGGRAFFTADKPFGTPNLKSM